MLDRRDISHLDGAVKARIVASEGLIFFSGLHPDSTAGGMREQMRGALANLDAALAEMGEDQRALFIVHVWIKDMRHFGAMNAEWNAWADPVNPPARTCVAGELYRPDLLVELVATASRSPRGQG